ncbi:DNA-binding transcriptional LysR family regulator [Actinokineospora auranticolor]|uniref:DNA-binding transcriptional LysR family regulator n=2 Tax=Actinokineospora auranticolor TaxID=155976 RepID=A0A2S6GDC1_9PSEU|nr:DNA-binding transcriptional LysR family regulator [Actinokineospora auranticolor]
MGVRVLERHEIETLLVLAEELHFGRTADRVGVSTSRVSQTVRRLERRVGAALFTRTSRRVELTDIGRALCADVRPGWAAITAGVDRAIRAGKGLTGTLRVGFVGAAGGLLVADAATALTDCEVVLREAQFPEAAPWLRDRVVDVVLACLPLDDPDFTPGPVLVTEARLVAVRADHPLARRRSVTADDLRGVPELRAPDDGTLQEILTLVGAGRGAFPVGAHARRYYPRPDVAYVPLTGAPPVRWGLVWRADNATARVRAFAAAAEELVRAR